MNFTGLKIWIVATGLILAFCSSCRKTYQPEVISVNHNYLVVDGIINTGGDSTVIKLSRTWPVNSDSIYPPEIHANVNIEDENGNLTYLQETIPGVYVTFNSFNNVQRYRLNIFSQNGTSYKSDFVQGIPTPPIDSVSWVQKDDGVYIYVTTHDTNPSAKYFRWDFTETWQYHAFYQSSVIYQNGSFLVRTPQQDIYNCWHTLPSTEILLGSTAALSSNLLYEKPVNFIAAGTERVSIRYSILVRQYALNQATYQYYELLKKNSEQLGSIFATEPSELTGNVHNLTNPSEPVLGMLSAGDMQQQRIFISNNQLPVWDFELHGCDQIIVTPDKFDAVFGHGGYIPINQHGLTDYTGAGSSCVDCTLAGGTNVKPSFW